MSYNFYYFHGWSYSNKFWDKFALSVSSENNFFYNRGYWGKFHRPILNTTNQNIAITHSMGLYFLLEDYSLKDFEKIIVIAGFPCFTKFTSVSHLRIMQRNLKRDALKTITDFQLLAGDNLNTKQQDFDINRLYDDLGLLASQDYTDSLLLEKEKLYCIEMDDDKIVSHSQNDLFQERYMIKGQNHVFAFEENRDLCQIIARWINKI